MELTQERFQELAKQFVDEMLALVTRETNECTHRMIGMAASALAEYLEQASYIEEQQQPEFQPVADIVEFKSDAEQ